MAVIFSKILAEADTECNLLIPTPLFDNLPFTEGHLLNLSVYDDKNDREWMFCCTVRRNEMAKEGVLSVGWFEFVQRNDLKPKDKVIFHEVKDGDQATLKIEVQRKIRLFGQDIWAQLP